MGDSDPDRLVERLQHYPPHRYPVQHATVQFHLGCSWLRTGEEATATAPLRAAAELFGQVGMGVEAAKARLMLGIALRGTGDLPAAAGCFERAAADLGHFELRAEQAAADYNLGLVRQALQDIDGAHDAWARARRGFESTGHPLQASSAAREHGASLLRTDRLDQALPLLEAAYGLAERAGDPPAIGAAANTLGLAQLAALDPGAAVRTLRHALGVCPRSLRPAEHALVKANLALAYQQAGDAPRARLAARQALSVPDAPAPVRAQARELLRNEPDADIDDLFAVLESDPVATASILREELARWVEITNEKRCPLVGGFLDRLLAHPAAAYDLAESYWAVVLELPPRPFDLVVQAMIAACATRGAAEVSSLQAILESAMARFALPQWQRLVGCLNNAALAAGQAANWR